MPKKCKNCGTAVEDTAKICPSCSNLAFEETTKFKLSQDQILELAKSVSENLAKKPRVLWGVTWRVALLVFALLGIPGAITGWNIWSSFENFALTTTNNIESKFRLLDQSSSNQIVMAYSGITNDVAVKFESFKRYASNQIVSAYSAVTNQIVEQFQEPRVKQTVENVAKGEARTILENEVRPVVEEFHTNVEGKLKAIESGEDFLELATRARAYDFKAYLQLRGLSTQTNDVGKFSSQVVAEIDRALDEYRASSGFLALFEESGSSRYSGPFTSDEIAIKLLGAHNDPAREAIVNAARDFKQPLFLSSFTQLFTNETDLRVADRETLAISEITKQDFHPRDLEHVKSWWEMHQSEYTNWPYAEFTNGSRQFSVGNYSAAAKSFEQVLKLDPAADITRAIAIACYWEISETNKAISSAKDFKNPSERWAQWASAKAELEAGSVSNATLHLANLYTNYPTMLLRIRQGEHIWRKVDWELFNQNVGQNK
jgi:tetratricopeptide (TPR) repeat protein